MSSVVSDSVWVEGRFLYSVPALATLWTGPHPHCIPLYPLCTKLWSPPLLCTGSWRSISPPPLYRALALVYKFKLVQLGPYCTWTQHPPQYSPLPLALPLPFQRPPQHTHTRHIFSMKNRLTESRRLAFDWNAFLFQMCSVWKVFSRMIFCHQLNNKNFSEQCHWLH